MKRRIACALVAALVFLAGSAPAANLLTNPGFDTDLSGWLEVDPAKTWTSFDEFGDPASGSVRFTVPALQLGNSVLIRQCVAATPGETLEFSASFYVPTQSGVGNAALDSLFYSSPDCSGSPGLTWQRVSSSAVDKWERLSQTRVVPTGAQSARTSLVCASGSANDFVCHADNAYLPEPDEAALALAGLGALGWLGVRRRAREAS